MRSTTSAWWKVGLAGLAAGLLLVMSGDGRVGAAVPVGIDPLDVLDLQVKSNAILVLDSSGSMRERPDCTGACNTPTLGEVAGDDVNAKLHQAKQVLKQIVQDNQLTTNFEFGRYVQDAASYTPETPAFRYSTSCASGDTTCQNNAAAILTNVGTTCSTSGLKRSATDVYTDAAGTIFYELDSDSTKFYNGDTVKIQTSGCQGGSTPVVTGGTDVNPPTVTVQIVDNSGSNVGTAVTFSWSGVFWNKGNANGSCGGFNALVALAPCNGGSLQFGNISPFLADEIALDANGNIAGYDNSTAATAKASLVTASGNAIKASGFTPIAESLIDIKAQFDGTIFPTRVSPLTPPPNTFVIFVTDGDDTCQDPSTPSSFPVSAAQLDTNALRAANAAQNLFADTNASVTTYVITYGTGASSTRANWIAWAGSGMNRDWSTAPTATDRANCTTCVDAFTPANADDLTDAIQGAINRGQSSGTFSASPSSTDSVFELVKGSTGCPGSSPCDAMDPDTRYDGKVPVRFQSSFTMPNFAGHLSAFRADSTNANLAAGAWPSSAGAYTLTTSDAGQKLIDLITSATALTVPSLALPKAGDPVQTWEWTYLQLAGAVTPTARPFTPGQKLKRRIFTSASNGVFAYATNGVPETSSNGSAAQRPTLLWPNDGTSNALDAAMGFGTLTTAQLTGLGACADMIAGTPTETAALACKNGTAGAKEGEARRILFAYLAGARVSRSTTGTVRRNSSSGAILYKARDFILADSTHAQPAIAGPPGDVFPSAYHKVEYQTFINGLLNGASKVNGIDAGFGLRNPDKDGTASNATDSTLKPVMTVVYLPANDGLHAFRAGPNNGNGSTGCTPAPPWGTGGTAGTECGGEELWSFVPFDQLDKIYSLASGIQTRANKTYMLGTSVRITEVFVPATSLGSIGTVAIPGSGKWRRLAIFGRGIGGKYYTALDITSPGAFTKTALATNLPGVVWSRGNIDTVDGTVGGSDNNSLNGNDKPVYGRMGQTWSIPAAGRVDPATTHTTRKPAGVDFVLWTGSGYGSIPQEGSGVYTLDAVTGDIVHYSDVGDRSGSGLPIVENAVVAPPAVYIPSLMILGPAPHPADNKATKVYVGDVQGRLWRFGADSTGPDLFADFGSDQPIADGAGLLTLNDGTSDRPYVFVETGNDNRVTPPPATTPPFNMYGLLDNGGSIVNSAVGGGTAILNFTEPFPNSPGPGFRGTDQPKTGLQDATTGRVFFLGTQFTPAGTGCASTFDSILFALGAKTGNAAYNLPGNGGKSFTFTGQRLNSVQLVNGQVVVDKGINALSAPAPAPPAVANPIGAAAPPPPADVYQWSLHMSSGVCR